MTYMKRIIRNIVVLQACLAASLSVSAQRYYSPEFWIGAKGGVTMSKTSFTPSVRQGWIQGVMGGVAVRYTEEKYFGLVAELNIEQRGWKEDFLEYPFDYQRKLTYLQLPVMTHIYFGRKVKGFVNLGPSVGLLLGSSIKANFDYRNPSSVEGFPFRNRSTEQLSMDVSRKFDYGISGGAGIEFVIKRRHAIQLEGRYYFGIGNIFPDAKKDVFSASRGMSIEVMLSYMFRVK